MRQIGSVPHHPHAHYRSGDGLPTCANSAEQLERAAMPGFRMPAEWTHHAATWTAWPHADDQWSEGLSEPRASLAAMITAIVDLDDHGRPRGERVELIVRNPDDEAEARAHLGKHAVGVRFHHFP